MDYMTSTEASYKWQISPRQVQRLLADKRIPFAKKVGRIWIIPAHAGKPPDLRSARNLSRIALCHELVEIKAAVMAPVSKDHPEEVLLYSRDPGMTLLYTSCLAYLKGDFSQALFCYQETENNLSLRLNLCPIAMAAAISLGDQKTYGDIVTFVSGMKREGEEDLVSVLADLTLATAAISAAAPSLAPSWLKEGDFSRAPSAYLPDLLYLRSKYFHTLNRYDAMRSLAQTALFFIGQDQCLSFYQIYLTLMCAVASYGLDDIPQARRWLLEAMDLALPHAFITPFVEHLAVLGGLLEALLAEYYPDLLDPVLDQWNETSRYWIHFHNQFTRDHISSILTPRECHIAQMATRRVPYEKIGRQFGISIGRVKNILTTIYDKLHISKRDELADYVFFIEKDKACT